MRSGDLPDHYAALNVPVDADRDTIRQAYKRAAFANHPDRAVSKEDEKERVLRFQNINEAYFILSDDQRRKQYDEARRDSSTPPQNNFQPYDAEAQFADIFEEALNNNPDVAGLPRQTGWFYSVAGSAAGAVLGFIIADIPGAIVGFVAGNRLGAIRDSHGKSVYEVFQELDPESRSAILANLAQKIFAQTFPI